MYIHDIYNVLETKGDRNAICLDGVYTTYEELRKKVNGIRLFIQKVIPDDVKGLGLVAYSHPDTYAAIIAFWLEGKYYVPLLPFAPIERNRSVINEGGIVYLFGRSEFNQDFHIRQFEIDKIDKIDEQISIKDYSVDALAYLLFTSGSTGTPKGVPITVGNLDSFVNSMNSLGHNLYDSDRCLQMFELTFDFSVASYVMPICVGACIYIIPEGELKADYVLDLLEEFHLTVLDLVPSVLTYFRKFFEDIREDECRLCSFCGEALMTDITKEWQKCIPNCRIINFYGPTENTVFCTYYDVNTDIIKNHNDVISIGKDMPGNQHIIVDDNNLEVSCNNEGELCLAGPQLTSGYWNNKEKNQKSFFDYKGIRYYKTGDLCYKDNDGDIMYVGRKDFQTKIQGFRVELSEIEHYAFEAVDSKYTCVCVAFQKEGLATLGLAIECKEVDIDNVLNYIREKIPPYEVPSKILCIPALPHNVNGKIDRKEIIKQFELCKLSN